MRSFSLNKHSFSTNELPRLNSRGILRRLPSASTYLNAPSTDLHPWSSRFKYKRFDISRAFLQISIILPVFNEGKNIAKQINGIEEKVKNSHEILIIYDFAEDDTVSVVRKLQKKNKYIKLIRNIFGRGLINAVKTGFIEARGEVFVVMPADLADDPGTVVKMFNKIEDGFDIVCATRYAKGGKKIGGPILKTTLSRIAGLLTPIILGIPTTDIANGFKMYRRNVLKRIKIESDGGWEFSTELVIKAYHAGFKIGEVSTTWQDRISGKSKFELIKWLPKYLRWYLWGFWLNINRLRFNCS